MLFTLYELYSLKRWNSGQPVLGRSRKITGKGDSDSKLENLGVQMNQLIFILFKFSFFSQKLRDIYFR